jgi:glycosyltransferase involved in cell wall biosynthesis
LRSVVYSHAYRHADRIATVSERTREDLGKLHPQWHAKSAAVRLGSDRPDRGASEATTERPVAIAYATHVNKRPHLVLRAWAVGVSRGDDLPPLAIVGAAPSMRDELDALRAELGLTADQVTAHGFLDDAEYDALLARARMVVLPSTFEGFGLPVIEALRLGVAVVITPEPAMREVGGPAVTVAADESAEALAGAVVDALRKDSRESRRAGIEWAAQYTWAASAAALRAELVRATSA